MKTITQVLKTHDSQPMSANFLHSDIEKAMNEQAAQWWEAGFKEGRDDTIKHIMRVGKCLPIDFLEDLAKLKHADELNPSFGEWELKKTGEVKTPGRSTIEMVAVEGMCPHQIGSLEEAAWYSNKNKNQSIMKRVIPNPEEETVFARDAKRKLIVAKSLSGGIVGTVKFAAKEKTHVAKYFVEDMQGKAQSNIYDALEDLISKTADIFVFYAL